MKQHPNLRAAFAPLLYVPTLLFVLSCAPALTKSSQTVFLQVGEHIEEDQSYLDLITPYKIKLDHEMGQVIARGAKELKKNQGESPLGNLVADMQMRYSEKKFGRRVDISVVNNGGLRNSLPEGDITLGDVFELAPFENVIYLLELTADDVEKVAEYAVKGKNLGMTGLHVEGKDGKLISFTVGGQQVVPGKSYVMAINDYLANGGDHMKFLIPLPRLEESSILMREMILDQMKEWTAAGKAIDAAIEGRQKLY